MKILILVILLLTLNCSYQDSKSCTRYGKIIDIIDVTSFGKSRPALTILLKDGSKIVITCHNGQIRTGEILYRTNTTYQCGQLFYSIKE